MDANLAEALERLSEERSFALAYGAYDYLAGLGDDVPSGTRALLRRVRAGEVAAVLECVGKMLEEQEEARLVLAGRHAHEGPLRDVLLREVGQSLYWTSLLAVGRGVRFESVGFVRFLRAGLAGEEPGKGEWQAGGEWAAAILRRALYAAGRALAEFNARPGEPGVELRDLALAELRQMAGKDYLLPYLRAGVR